MTYRIQWKSFRYWFWTKTEVIGHKYEQNYDKMIMYMPDGCIREIPEWSKKYVFLGLDWKIFVQKEMEKESGQKINVR